MSLAIEALSITASDYVNPSGNPAEHGALAILGHFVSL
jgi:hypothetical protein